MGELFQAQVAVERLHPCAALAVYHRGRLAVDLVTGLADTQRGVPVSADTLFTLRSAGKPFASVALLQLIEQGRLELEAPVATYWPRFALHGKGAVTVSHVLTHRGGFADSTDTDGKVPLGDLEPDRRLDEDAVAGALEGLPLRYPPGTASSYSGVTQQWVCVELVRRVDGRPFPTYLREEITGPLEMNDTNVGLAPELEAGVARPAPDRSGLPGELRRGLAQLPWRPPVAGPCLRGLDGARHGAVLCHPGGGR